jgi:hypothetical protein
MNFDIVTSTYWSVNHQVICEELTPCRYGTAILHDIHFIIHLCLWHRTLTLMNPTDKDRLQGSLQMSVQAITLMGPFYWWH